MVKKKRMTADEFAERLSKSTPAVYPPAPVKPPDPKMAALLEKRYLVLTLEDASAIATALRILDIGAKSEAIARIQARLLHDTGANMQEIVNTLCDEEVCFACDNEGVAVSCGVLAANKQGRRLRRLLERARRERPTEGK
jgi:hypothetical protein